MVPGEIRVSRIVALLDDPVVKVWSVELTSKFADVLSYGESCVYLRAGARTQQVDKTLLGKVTIIELGLVADWQLIAEVHRYACTIVAIQIPSGVETVDAWPMPEDGS